ncbi:MAG: hypothetical protein HYX26_10020 [Acidobacteriales bacterium]|nr:hypothetical protein [Terriglobales bacterium]
MKRLAIRIVVSGMVLAGSSAADTKLKTRTTVQGHSFESTTYIKGQRQRSEMNLAPGMSTITITQCDQKRIITLSACSKSYMVTSLDEEETPAGEAKPATNSQGRQQRPTRSGGVITLTTDINDTGERKKLFGFTARRVKTAMSSQAEGNTCSKPQDMNMTSDGWYIDLENNFSCSSSPRAMMAMRPPTNQPECRDQMRFKRTGTGRQGYPLMVDTTFDAGGRSNTMKMETLELSTADLDLALFEVPVGYTETTSYQQLMCMGNMGDMMRAAGEESGRNTRYTPTEQVQQQSANYGASFGKVRVGVIPAGLAVRGAAPPTAQVQPMLVGLIQQYQVDAVPLNIASTASREEADKAAREKGCDFFVYTDVNKYTPPGTGKKAGGLFGSVLGANTASDKTFTYEMGVQFRVFAVGDPAIRLDSTRTTNEGSTIEAGMGLTLDSEAQDVVVQVRKDAEWRRRGVLPPKVSQ